MDWTTLISIITALGGWEAVKYLINRRTNRRLEEARADRDDFGVLREVNTFLQEQLRAKEARFAEQTDLVRQLNSEVLRLTAEVSMLKAERAMKLCERRGCKERLPQSGY